MKPLFQLLIALFICTNAFAQNLDVRYGAFNELKLSDAMNLELFGNGERQFAIYSHGLGKSRKTTMAALDQEYRLVRPTPWGPPAPDQDASKMVTMKARYNFGDHYKVFYAAYYPKEKKYVNYATYLDMEGKFNDKVIPLDKVDARLLTAVHTSIVHSPDLTKIGLYEFPTPTNRKANQTLIVRVYDNNLRSLYYTGLEVPYASKDFDILSYGVDNNGNAIFIGKIDGKDSKDWAVFSYNHQTKKVTETRIKRNNADMKYLFNPHLDLDDQNNLYLTAMWGKVDNASKAQGFMISRFNHEGVATEWTIVKEFDNDLRSLEDMEDAKTRNFKFDGIYTFSNGEFLFLLEKRYEVHHHDSKGRYVSTTYYGNEVVGMRMDKQGNVKYSFLLPKYQSQRSSSGNTDFIYARYIKTDDHLFIMYNDKVDNLNKKPGDKFVKFSSAHNDAGTVAAKVDLSNGKYTKMLLTSNCPEKDKSPFFDFSTFTQIGDGTYLVKCDITARDKFRFATVMVK